MTSLLEKSAPSNEFPGEAHMLDQSTDGLLDDVIAAPAGSIQDRIDAMNLPGPERITMLNALLGLYHALGRGCSIDQVISMGDGSKPATKRFYVARIDSSDITGTGSEPSFAAERLIVNLAAETKRLRVDFSTSQLAHGDLTRAIGTAMDGGDVEPFEQQ